MKNYELAPLIKNLSSIDGKIPVKLGFRIAQNIKILKEAENLRISEHNRLIKTYAADGKTVRETDDLAGFRKDLNELIMMDADVNLKTVTLEETGDLEMTMEQINALACMIEEAVE